MSTKITLGKPPKTYAPVKVTFPMPDGSEGAIECVFKFRSRKQFGSLIAETFENPVDVAGTPRNLSDVMTAAVSLNGAYLVAVLDSWSLDEKLDTDSASELADEYPAAVIAIKEAYGRAVTEGRLGN